MPRGGAGTGMGLAGRAGPAPRTPLIYARLVDPVLEPPEDASRRMPKTRMPLSCLSLCHNRRLAVQHLVSI
jgi:hypothetical protein